MAAEIVKNLNATFDGRPIFCQLYCDTCQAIFCGAWRNDWISRLCRECRSGQASPLIDYVICKNVFAPSGSLLN